MEIPDNVKLTEDQEMLIEELNTGIINPKGWLPKLEPFLERLPMVGKDVNDYLLCRHILGLIADGTLVVIQAEALMKLEAKVAAVEHAKELKKSVDEAHHPA